MLHRRETDAELSDEIAQYIELAAQEHMRAGLPRDEAERRAHAEFGGVESAKEGVRAAGWDGALQSIGRDVGYAFRGLRRNPGFTVVALLTLMLGIGANTAMFSVVNAVLLRPLPYHEPERVALVWTDDIHRGLHQQPTAYLTIEDWRKSARSFDGVGYYSAARTAFTANGRARGRTRSAFISGNVFSLLGVRPTLGRPITTADESTGAMVAVISYGLWQRQFGGDTSAIGATIQTEDGKEGAAYTIVGVLPREFYFPDKLTELWVPAVNYWRFRRESTERYADWARRWTAVVRLRHDVTVDDARRDLARIGNQLAATYHADVPDFPGFATTVMPMLDYVAGRNLQRALWVLLAAVTLVLLVSCANVANLLLARGAARRREFAIRRALGAGRTRVVRQLLVESVVLSVVGGALGLLVARIVTRMLVRYATSQLPRMDELALDNRVLAFAAITAVTSGILFGMVPALRVSGADAADALRGGSALGDTRLTRTRGWLIVAECASAIMLLCGAGLLLRSMGRLTSVDPGFDARNVLTVRVEFPPEAPPTDEERRQGLRVEPLRAQARVGRLDALIDRIAALPGVTNVGLSDDMFIAGQGHASITIPGGRSDSVAGGELNDAAASPGFFTTMRVPLRKGRYLNALDVQQKIRALWTPVTTQLSLADKEQLAVREPVVVNDAFVRRYFPTEDPIGKRFCIDPTNKTYWYEIVGVVGNMRRQGQDRDAIPEYYGPYLPSPNGRADLLIRTANDPSAAASSVRAAIAQQFPGITIVNVSTADRLLGDFHAQRDFQTWVLAVFAALAAVLAAVGIYGVVHYAVAERTREMGLRVALGASPAELFRLVVVQGMRMPMLGIGLGIVGALATTRVLSHLLFGIDATDPLTFAGVVAVLVAVAAAACYVPARRAARIDPMIALRHD
jgi:putative ABC transport system permease protein